MSKFKQNDFRVQSESGSKGARIVKVEQGFVSNVQDFSMPPLAEEGQGEYSQVKAKFGSLAMTDATERSTRNTKDRRFNLSQLVRSHLSVDEEERRAIEERVKERVDTLSEEARKVAADLGYEEGKSEGYEKAYQEFQNQGQSRIKQLESIIKEFENAKQDIFRINERFLIDMVYRIAKMVLLREVSTDRQYVLRLAKELIERVGVRENINIKICAEDLESIQMLRDGLDASFGAMKNVNIEVSNQVHEGGCMIDTEWNAIDASVETQLKGIFESLLGQQATGGNAT